MLQRHQEGHTFQELPALHFLTDYKIFQRLCAPRVKVETSLSTTFLDRRERLDRMERNYSSVASPQEETVALQKKKNYRHWHFTDWQNTTRSPMMMCELTPHVLAHRMIPAGQKRERSSIDCARSLHPLIVVI
jgi:hypothetical protein